MKRTSLLTNFSANFGLDGFGRTVAHAANIKIKRNNFFEGFVGYRKCVHLMNILQVQKITSLIPSSLAPTHGRQCKFKSFCKKRTDKKIHLTIQLN